MRIAVLHNAVHHDAPPEDQDTLVQVEAVREALIRLGHKPTAVSCTLDLAAMQDELRRSRPELVFNLVEALADADSLIHLPAAVMDVMGLPYTGSRSESLLLTTNKLLAKQRLRAAGLPTPDWAESNGQQWGRHSCLPEGRQECLPHHAAIPSWIIKGVCEQGSRDMDDGAVFSGADLSEVRGRLAERVLRYGRPCFAEEFVEGREFNLALLAGPRGPEVLPPAEIDFSAFPIEKPRIVGHRAKWQADSFEYHHTPQCFDFEPADGPLLKQLSHLSRECWALFGLRGWGRVDFRVDAAGQPWILEINANPCLSADAGSFAAISRASISFDEAIRRILGDSIDLVS
jgi:D-alanine-D-alanine ligase